MNHLIELLSTVRFLGMVYLWAMFVAALGLLIFDRMHIAKGISQPEIMEERQAA